MKHSDEVRHSFVPGLLVTVLTVAILTITAMLFIAPVHEGNKEILLIILGVLLSRFSDSISYYIGTSHSSVSKNKLIRSGERKVRACDTGDCKNNS